MRFIMKKATCKNKFRIVNREPFIKTKRCHEADADASATKQ